MLGLLLALSSPLAEALLQIEQTGGKSGKKVENQKPLNFLVGV
jgi:hypothetical protein